MQNMTTGNVTDKLYYNYLGNRQPVLLCLILHPMQTQLQEDCVHLESHRLYITTVQHVIMNMAAYHMTANDRIYFTDQPQYRERYDLHLHLAYKS